MKPPASGTAKVRAARQRRRFEAAQGKCFYCGGPIQDERVPLSRDWLFVRPIRHRMVSDHKVPRQRGGPDDPANYETCCHGCNNRKSAFNVDEFRMIVGLRAGTLSHSFSGEAPRIARDWLCCHSPAFEQVIVVHNFPAAQAGYDVRRPIGSRRARATARHA